MDNKELHETQPASTPLPAPDVAKTMPTKMHPLPSSVLPGSTPTWIIILLLVFFPPLAWYFMWKEARYHRWFPVLLWLYGIISITLFAIITIFVYPQINKLFESLNIERENTWLPYAAGTAVLLGICEILFGIFLFKKTQNGTALPNKLLLITLIILFIQWITIPVWTIITQVSIISPVYMITSGF
ncbi:MAG: hypothetical protein RLZZ455_1109 [Candidatus Parcubacteria bacterium]|jgi:hypothetical protein